MIPVELSNSDSNKTLTSALEVKPNESYLAQSINPIPASKMLMAVRPTSSPSRAPPIFQKETKIRARTYTLIKMTSYIVRG